MRVPTVLVAVVAALGGFAVYRMVRAPTTAFDGTLPDEAGEPGTPPPGSTVMPGPTANLGAGHWYAGRIEDDALRPDDLTRMGFHDVRWFATPDEAAPHVPDYALDNPGKLTRWFLAQAVGKTTFTFPPGLVLFWSTLAPKAA